MMLFTLPLCIVCGRKNLLDSTMIRLIGFVFRGSFVYAIFGQVGVNAWGATVFRDKCLWVSSAILLIWVIFATIDIPETGGGKVGVFPAVMVAQLLLIAAPSTLWF